MKHDPQARIACRKRPARIACALLILLLTGAPAPSMAADNYRLVVSFASRCCGPNIAAMQKLQAQIKRSEQQAGRPIKVESRSRGPEGEVALCYRLDELSEAQRTDLATRINHSLAKEPLTDVQQNAACPEAVRRGE